MATVKEVQFASPYYITASKFVAYKLVDAIDEVAEPN
jgi:hypothetical protein